MVIVSQAACPSAHNQGRAAGVQQLRQKGRLWLKNAIQLNSLGNPRSSCERNLQTPGCRQINSSLPAWTCCMLFSPSLVPPQPAVQEPQANPNTSKHVDNTSKHFTLAFPNGSARYKSSPTPAQGDGLACNWKPSEHISASCRCHPPGTG